MPSHSKEFSVVGWAMETILSILDAGKEPHAKISTLVLTAEEATGLARNLKLALAHDSEQGWWLFRREAFDRAADNLPLPRYKIMV